MGRRSKAGCQLPGLRDQVPGEAHEEPHIKEKRRIFLEGKHLHCRSGSCVGKMRILPQMEAGLSLPRGDAQHTAWF